MTMIAWYSGQGRMDIPVPWLGDPAYLLLTCGEARLVGYEDDTQETASTRELRRRVIAYYAWKFGPRMDYTGPDAVSICGTMATVNNTLLTSDEQRCHVSMCVKEATCPR